MRAPALTLVLFAAVLAGCVTGPAGPSDLETSSPATDATRPTSRGPSASPGPSAQPNGTSAPPRPGVGAPPASGETGPPACDGLPDTDPRPTGGHDDENITSLAWAALKTGNRFIVTWDSGSKSTATLRVKVGNGNWQSYTDSERRIHAILVEGLSVGKVLCFEASHTIGGTTTKSQLHGVRLANAMNAYDAANGTYSLNLLTVANQRSHRGILEEGYRIFADRLYDATDGYVRAGELIVIYNDVDHPHVGIAVVLYGFSFAPRGAPFDVTFQHDYPLAAGYTYRDAIKDPDRFIVMNSFHEAPAAGIGLSPSAREVGMVLLHEMGHYAFGALDLYTDFDDCFDSGNEISIMGSDREATEFDDEVNRCPNASSISGYVPTWKLLRDRYRQIPDREGVILEGPSGNGGLFRLTAFDLMT